LYFSDYLLSWPVCPCADVVHVPGARRRVRIASPHDKARQRRAQLREHVWRARAELMWVSRKRARKLLMTSGHSWRVTGECRRLVRGHRRRSASSTLQGPWF
jgi:hypothetical protein